MKRILRIIVPAIVSLSVWSCYGDYVDDYDFPNMGFALTRQIRTVVPGTNQLYVGVSIGGKREVDMNDWAEFIVDESLLEGLSYSLLPSDYYSLSDQSKMRPRKNNLAVADVGISFTEEFFNDSQSAKNTYALPLRIVRTSLAVNDGEQNSHIREGGETAVIVIKYISDYSGMYYKIGSEVEIDSDGNEIGDPIKYREKDLIKNQTCSLTTVSRHCVSRTGLGTDKKGGMNIYITESESSEAYTVRLEEQKGGGVTDDCSAKYVMKGDYTFYSSDDIAPQFELNYVYTSSDKYYKVSELLVLRQWPEYDLRVETF